MSERKLVGTGEMFKKALAGGYAIGAYNVNNMEFYKVLQKQLKKLVHQSFYKFQQVLENMLTKHT